MTTTRTRTDALVSLASIAGLACLLELGPSGCADKAPPARFSDPPPPTLARPLPPDQLEPDGASEPAPTPSDVAADEAGAANESDSETEPSEADATGSSS